MTNKKFNTLLHQGVNFFFYPHAFTLNLGAMRISPVINWIGRKRALYRQQRQFLLILSGLVGLAVGFSAVIIKNLVHFIKVLLMRWTEGTFSNYVFFVFPIAGIFLTILFIRYINRRPVRPGIPSVLFAKRNIFPVVDEEGFFRGIVKSDGIRNLMFETDLYDKTYVRDLMFMPENTIDLNESTEEVARKFHESGRYNIAVLKDGKYLGFLSRAKVFSSYRERLKQFSDE